MSNPYWQRHPGLVWSNLNAGDEVYLRAALLKPRFHRLLEIALEFGVPRLEQEWRVLTKEAAEETRRVSARTERMLRHINQGFAHAKA